MGFAAGNKFLFACFKLRYLWTSTETRRRKRCALMIQNQVDDPNLQSVHNLANKAEIETSLLCPVIVLPRPGPAAIQEARHLSHAFLCNVQRKTVCFYAQKKPLFESVSGCVSSHHYLIAANKALSACIHGNFHRVFGPVVSGFH